MNIQNVGSSQSLAQLLMNKGPSGPQAIPQGKRQGAPPAQVLSIKNDQGQSLVDIRDELKSAVRGALKESDGSDPRAAIEEAINATLEDHGFDPGEVKSAMQDAGFDPSKAKAFHRRNSAEASFSSGNPFGGRGDQHSLLSQSGQSEEDLVQSFLQKFRAGINLDLEV